MTNGVYQILNDNALMTEHKGVLARTMLDRILPQGRYPRDKHLFVIDMMRKFELCFDLEPDQQFLIPDLLNKEEPDTGDWAGALAFQYHYNVLPGSIISRFIVRANRLISRRTYWRSGAVLAYEGSRVLVKADRDDRKIFIRVAGAQATRRNLLTAIRTQFDAIHHTIVGIEAIEQVPLPGRPDVTVSYKHLLTLERNHVRSFIPDGLEKPVAVKPLLAGVESVSISQNPWRDESGEDADAECDRAKYDLRGATIHGFAPEGEGNALVSGRTVRGNMAIGSQSQMPSESLTKAEVLDLLAQIKALIAAADLPGEMKGEANAHLKVARKVTELAEPKKEIALAMLESIAETLETASKTVEAGKILWEQVDPMLVLVGRWLGAAAGSLLG